MTNKEARTQKWQSPEGILRFEFIFNQAPECWVVGGREKKIVNERLKRELQQIRFDAHQKVHASTCLKKTKNQ